MKRFVILIQLLSFFGLVGCVDEVKDIIEEKIANTVICQGVHSSDPLQLTSEQLWERFDYLMNSSLQLRGLHPVLPTIQNRDTCVNISGLDLSRDNIQSLLIDEQDPDVNKLRYLKLVFFWNYAAENSGLDLSRNDLNYYESFLLDNWGYSYQDLVNDISMYPLEESFEANLFLAMDFTDVLAENTDFSLQSFRSIPNLHDEGYLSINLNNMKKALSVDQFSALESFPKVFPVMNGAGLDLSGKIVSGINLSQVANMSAAQFDNLDNIQNITFPAINGVSLDFSGKSLGGVDLSLVSNVSAVQINQATSILGLVFPIMNGVGLNFSGKTITRADLTRVTQLSAAQLNNALHFGTATTAFYRVKLPVMDASTLNFNGISIREADLSRVTGLTQAQVDSASHSQNTILPNYL